MKLHPGPVAGPRPRQAAAAAGGRRHALAGVPGQGQGGQGQHRGRQGVGQTALQVLPSNWSNQRPASD